MFHYRYSPVGPGRPPAAFVHVNLSSDETGRRVESLPALADTGADQTVLPDRVVSELQLVPFDRVTVSGYNGPAEDCQTYLVRLAVRDLPPVEMTVLASWSESYAILGRDLLNRHRVVFDGPNQRLEFG